MRTPAEPPSRLWGQLFERVQRGGVYRDSKTFADAVPLRSAEVIMSAFRESDPTNPDELRAFVTRHFKLDPGLPVRSSPSPLIAVRGLRARIAELWPVLTRPPSCASGSSLAVHQPHTVPGERFGELYYWDSYFTMLGLRSDGLRGLVESMLEVFTTMLEQFGYVPNGTRTYYLGRSQPPVYSLMCRLSEDQSLSSRRRRLNAMVAEYGFWMRGAADLQSGSCALRVARMSDGSLLNRYWSDDAVPRDEAWREDVALANETERSSAELFREIRAAAESGWDFSSRWFPDGGGLAAARTTTIIPVDLNSLMYALEDTIAREAAGLGDADTAIRFRRAAAARRSAIDTFCWSNDLKSYGDYDLVNGRTTGVVSGASLWPLWLLDVDSERGTSTAHVALTRLLGPGGLRATEQVSGEQWDAPNGWAPIQWGAFNGLIRHGRRADADDLARRWISMVEGCLRTTGYLYEKYDVDDRSAGWGGEYPVQHGFGWTNGVTAALLERMSHPDASVPRLTEISELSAPQQNPPCR